MQFSVQFVYFVQFLRVLYHNSILNLNLRNNVFLRSLLTTLRSIHLASRNHCAYEWCGWAALNHKPFQMDQVWHSPQTEWQHCLRPTRALAITCPVSWQSKSLAATQGEPNPIHPCAATSAANNQIFPWLQRTANPHTERHKDRRLKLKASESKSDLGLENGSSGFSRSNETRKTPDNLHIYEEERPLIKLQNAALGLL